MLKAYFIIALLFSALAAAVLFGTVHAQPSVPEFTVKLVSHPYVVTPHDTVDPYTGIVTTYPSYVDENRSIEVTIKNQPFNSYQMADGNWSSLYYNLRFKGHFTDDWWYYPLSHVPAVAGYINASLLEYTVISLDDGLYGHLMLDRNQIDFQIQALIGYDEAKYASGADNSIIFVGYDFTGEASDWSSTQTLKIGEVQTSTPSPTTTPTAPPTSTPYQEPQQTEQEIVIGIAITLAVICTGLGLLIYLIKRK